MSDFYKLIEIDGKGFGCVATKKIKPGTLIFSEKPAVNALGNCPETICFKTMMSSFKNSLKMIKRSTWNFTIDLMESTQTKFCQKICFKG